MVYKLIIYEKILLFNMNISIIDIFIYTKYIKYILKYIYFMV